MSIVIDGNSKMTVWGESHGPEIGGVIDGFPAGVKYDEEFALCEMARRAPSSSAFSTKRKEKDIPVVVSGIKDNVTEGSPIAFRILNEDRRSKDYGNIEYTVRPSHADYTAYERFSGHNDVRGGGHFSGRLTAPMVFAGALAKMYLHSFGVKIAAHIRNIGDISDDSFVDHANADVIERIENKTFPSIKKGNSERIEKLIGDIAKDGDSIGAIVECGIFGVKAGIGGYMARSVESRIASAMYAIPALKGIEFGKGFSYALGRGSEMNDCFKIEGGKVVTTSNNNGGVLGGITSGMPIVFSAAMKPTPSIYKPQMSVDISSMTEKELIINGRHDPCVAIRAIPVIEAVAALTVCDMYLEAYGYNGTK